MPSPRSSSGSSSHDSVLKDMSRLYTQDSPPSQHSVSSSVGSAFANLFFETDERLDVEYGNEEMMELGSGEHRGIPIKRTDCSSSQVENIYGRYRKRRSDEDSGEPPSKKRLDKVSARLENFHISTDSGQTSRELEDSDSSEDTEKIEEEEGTLLLDEKLRDYIIQHREAPAIINNPPSLALVPYVPAVSFDNPAMTGRIKEISSEDAKGYVSSENGVVTFPEEAPLESAGFMNEGAEQNSESLASVMNVTEIGDIAEDDSVMEVDS